MQKIHESIKMENRKFQEKICVSCNAKFSTKNPKKSKDGEYRCKNFNNNKHTLNFFHLNKDKKLRKTFGITYNEYKNLLKEQNNVCAICKSPEIRKRKSGVLYDLAVDHNHKTGKVRGLLCKNCNWALGQLKDNPNFLIDAHFYLSKHDNIPSWDEYFMNMAILASTRSKDPSTKVGAILVKDKFVLSTGYNGLASKLNDDIKERWERPLKYRLVIHAEMNAIIQGLRKRVDLTDATLYCTLYPCTECAKALIQSGIKEIIYLKRNNIRFEEDFKLSEKMFQECKVLVRSI